MTIKEELELLHALKEETIDQVMNHFVCEWYEMACIEKLANLNKRIKELEETMNESERNV